MTNSVQPQSAPSTTPSYIVPEQMFALIDSVLPFEVCLYHQVLPLSVRDSILFLGTVHPDESEGLKYVRTLLAHTSYTINLKPISATTQQHYLSAFLSYDRQLKEAGEDLIEHSAEMPLVDAPTFSDLLDDSQSSTIPDGRLADLLEQQVQETQGGDDTVTPGLEATVAVPIDGGADGASAANGRDKAEGETSRPEGIPDGVLEATIEVDLEAIAQGIPVPSFPFPPKETPAPSEQREPSTNPPKGKDDSFAQEFEAALAAADIPQFPYAAGICRSALIANPSIGTSHSVALPSSKPNPPTLVLDQVTIEALTPDNLGTLAPRALTQALLQQSIMQGIGRLFLERYPGYGRILCSQDGMLEKILDPIPLPSFQGVINELKLLAEIPLLQVERVKQADVERMYQGELLLLRLRLTPGIHGEEATLQVLRGAALKFYQQQQLSKLGQNALTLARRLQHQVAEIEARSRLLPGVGAESFPSVPELRQLVRYISTTLDHLYYP